MREVLAPDGGGRTPFGIAVGIGAAAMVAATAMSAAMLPPADMAARLALASVAVGVCAATTADARASLVTAGLGYLLFCGFLVNRNGELAWDGTTSVWHLTAFAVAVALGIGWRWIRHARADLAIDDELEQMARRTESKTKESHGG